MGAPDPIPYKQRALPYAYTALEPAIDAMTMEIHYTKHAAAYVMNIGEAVDALGHYNHSLFWELMTSPGKTTAPSAALMTSIIFNS